MDYGYYERKINDIILKCPIEAGVEILAYQLLDRILDSKELSLVDINRLWKDRDKRLTTDAGIPDIAILSEDFRYREEDKGQVYGFVEVKATNIVLAETEQVAGHKAVVPHYLYTNGLVWKYFKKAEFEWEVALAYSNGEECKKMTNFQRVLIDEGKFNELKDKLNKIDWK